MTSEQKQILTYLAKLVNLELDRIVYARIAEKVKDFNVADFIKFVEYSLDRTELQYKNGMQKFLKLVQMFEKEINRNRHEEAMNEVQKLDEKFRTIKPLLVKEHEEDRDPTLEMLRDKDTKESYFTDFELKQLNAISNVRWLIRLSNQFLLVEKLEENFLNLIYKKQPKALPAKPKQMAIGNRVNLKIKRMS